MEETNSIVRLDPIDQQLKHFSDIVLENELPLVTVDDGYTNLVVADAIKKSSISKSQVILDKN